MNVLEMRAVCLVCGHYPLYNWVAPVVDQFNATFRDTQAFAGIEFHYPGEGTEVGGDHAAKWETSYLWYLRPDCVDMSVFLDRDAEEAMGIWRRPARTASGVGPAGCELIVEGMVAKAHELIAGLRNGLILGAGCPIQLPVGDGAVQPVQVRQLRHLERVRSCRFTIELDAEPGAI
jgi:hypothetical protein